MFCMSTRLETRPWLTKNFAVGAVDTAEGSSSDRTATVGAVDGTSVNSARRAGPPRTSDGCHAPYHPGMLLAVDIGNTNVTLGLFRNGSLAATRRATTHPRSSADELEHLIDALLRLDDASFADVSAISSCSVVPALTAALEVVATRRERPLLIAAAGI